MNSVDRTEHSLDLVYTVYHVMLEDLRKLLWIIFFGRD